MIEAALEQIPGRAIVNSINLEAGRDKADRVIPLAKAHGAALIALTIDEVGMAKTADRKVEIAKRITRHRRATSTASTPSSLIFDALTFTLTTGDDEWKPSAVETIEGIRRIKAELPGRQDLAGRLERLLRRLAAAARGPQLGLPAPLRRGRARPGDGQPEPHHALLARSPRRSASSPTTSSSTAARTRSSASSATSSRRARRTRRRRRDPTEGMEPEEALHWHILRRKKDGVEDWIDKSVEKIGAVPTLNDVLLPAMKEVGDKFGAGELILPFVLQSAEVMKRAVAQLENYLERIEGHTKGKVVIATVFGDVHDIGKSLVNTILTNNGYTVVDLGKQVPIDTIINAADRARGRRDRPLRAARLDLEADARLRRRSCTSAGPRVPGADRRRRDQPRLRPPHPLPEGQGVRRGLRARRLLLQGRLPGARHDGRSWSTPTPARALVEKIARRGQDAAREAGGGRRLAADDRRLASARARAPTRPIPEPPFWGVREIDVDLDDVYPYLDRHVLFKLHWGGRGVKGEEWRKIARGRRRGRGLRAAGSSACGASRTTCARARGSATSPATPTATSS